METDHLTSAAMSSAQTSTDIAHRIAAEQHLTLVQYCGGGGYGQVWLALDSNGWRRAFKIVNVATHESDVAREMRGVREYCNRVNDEESLLTIFHQGLSYGYFWYLMQLADDARADDGSYLADSLEVRLRRQGTMTARELHPIVSQVLDGVKALHSHGLVHRDIKPANILFVKGRAVLGDVGLVEDSSAVSLAGTEPFVPREIVAQMTHSIDGQMQDLFAVGCLIRLLLGVDFSINSRNGYRLPTDRVSRRLNALTLHACSTDTARRYRDVDKFRRDFEACYGVFEFMGAGHWLALALGCMALMVLGIGLGVMGMLEREEKTRPEPPPAGTVLPGPPSGSGVAVGESVNWYTLLSRTRTIRDYAFGSVMPAGLNVTFTPAGSGIGFLDQGNLRCRRRSGVLGRSSITLRFAGPLPRSFEMIWLSGGDFGGMTETASLKAGEHGGTLTAHVLNGAYGTGALQQAGSNLAKQGFMSVHRLICVDGRLRLLVDGLPMGKVDTGLESGQWESLTLHYDVSGSGEIYFSSIRLNEFLD